MQERSYRQLCGVARALDVVGNRWSLLIIRNLLVGPQRYSELLETLPGITTNLLADRLKHLEETGILHKEGARPYAEYRLLPRGESLRAVVLALGEWGSQCPTSKDAIGNLRWGLLSLTRSRHPSFQDCAIIKEKAGRDFILQALKKNLRVVERPVLPISVTLAGSGNAFLALFFGKKSAKALVKEGALNLSGDARAQARWLQMLGPSTE
jgi:DNA-binding HxlR family transcriptional regulator